MNANETMEIRLVTNIEKIADIQIEQTIFELDNQIKMLSSHAGKIVHIPPIKSGAIIGNIEQLKLGYVFTKFKDELAQNIKTGSLDYK